MQIKNNVQLKIVYQNSKTQDIPQGQMINIRDF